MAHASIDRDDWATRWEPPREVRGESADRLREAEVALSRLEVLGGTTPGADWLVRALAAKEAMYSLRLEGERFRLEELLIPEAPRDAWDRVREAQARARMWLGTRDAPTGGANEAPPLVQVGVRVAQAPDGMVGRALVPLSLQEQAVLTRPLLAHSLFVFQRRNLRARRLRGVREDGDWNAWLTFFLDGLARAAQDALATAQDLVNLVAEDRSRALTHARTSVAAARLFEHLPHHPVVTIAHAMRLLDTSKPTANRAVSALEAAGILTETTGKKRDRAWAYRDFLSHLAAGSTRHP